MLRPGVQTALRGPIGHSPSVPPYQAEPLCNQLFYGPFSPRFCGCLVHIFAAVPISCCWEFSSTQLRGLVHRGTQGLSSRLGGGRATAPFVQPQARHPLSIRLVRFAARARRFGSGGCCCVRGAPGSGRRACRCGLGLRRGPRVRRRFETRQHPS